MKFTGILLLLGLCCIACNTRKDNIDSITEPSSLLTIGQLKFPTLYDDFPGLGSQPKTNDSPLIKNNVKGILMCRLKGSPEEICLYVFDSVGKLRGAHGVLSMGGRDSYTYDSLGFRDRYNGGCVSPPIFRRYFFNAPANMLSEVDYMRDYYFNSDRTDNSIYYKWVRYIKYRFDNIGKLLASYAIDNDGSYIVINEYVYDKKGKLIAVYTGYNQYAAIKEWWQEHPNSKSIARYHYTGERIDSVTVQYINAKDSKVAYTNRFFFDGQSLPSRGLIQDTCNISYQYYDFELLDWRK